MQQNSTSQTWFISDTHFGHANILQYEQQARPFQSLDEMHTVMITKWNSVVKENDVVFHLGDVVFGRKWLSLLPLLNGRKRLVMGNHDVYPVQEYMPYFERIHGTIFWKKCVLSHMPLHERIFDRCLLNVHGHLHSQYLNDPRYVNVSCEMNDLIPINALKVLERAAKANIINHFADVSKMVKNYPSD